MVTLSLLGAVACAHRCLQLGDGGPRPQGLGGGLEHGSALDHVHLARDVAVEIDRSARCLIADLLTGVVRTQQHLGLRLVDGGLQGREDPGNERHEDNGLDDEPALALEDVEIVAKLKRLWFCELGFHEKESPQGTKGPQRPKRRPLVYDVWLWRPLGAKGRPASG